MQTFVRFTQYVLLSIIISIVRNVLGDVIQVHVYESLKQTYAR